MIAFEWRRHGNQVSIRLDRRGAGVQIAALYRGFHHPIQLGFNDMNLPTVNGIYRVLIDINADDALLPGGESCCRGQSDIAQANNGEGCKAHSVT